jgi:hypothetical protein
VVIGLTAFFSMLERPESIGRNLVRDLQAKKDLELRGRLSQLHKIAFDQFILCQSYSLGKLASFE